MRPRARSPTCAAKGPLVSLALSGLDEAAVAAVLARHDATGDAAAYRERTGGNPFFLDELLREEAEDATAGFPPPGVCEVIRRRIARLPGPGRCVLQAGAAQGMEFEPLVLTTPERVVDGLAAAVAAGLLTQIGERRYAFPHALVAEAVLADMSPSRRGCLHLRIADVLTEQDRHPGEIVKHVRAAGQLAPPERHVAAELAAARHAEAALAYADAAGHYEAALVAGAPDRAEILLALGAAHDRAGRRPQARAAFVQVVELARDVGCARLLARAALGRGGVGVLVAAPDAALSGALEEALTRLPAGERALAARLRARLAIERYYPDRVGAEELSERAVEDARASGDPAALAAALNGRRVALWTPERIDERLDASTEMIAAAEAAGDREGMLQGRNWRVVDLMELGQRTALESEIDAYTELADVVGLAHYRWYVPLWRSTLAQLEGRWEHAVTLGRDALALAGEAADAMAPWLVRVQRDCALDVRGHPEDLDRAYFAEQAAASADPFAWLVSVVLIDAVRGDQAGARRQLARLMADFGPDMPAGVNWPVLGDLAEAVTLLGDRAAAARVYERLEPNARLFPVIARGGICLGSAQYFLGRLATALGRRDEAELRLRRALTENLRVGAHPRATLARFRLGELRGDRDLLLEAATRADELEMTGIAAKARRAADADLAYAA